MNKAELLWLWCDYQTEQFDRTLPCLPEPYPDGAVAVDPAHRGQSSRFAYQMQNFIRAIATYYEVEDWLMMEEEKNRAKEKINERLKRYDWIVDNMPELLVFIAEYFELMSTIRRPVEKEGPFNALQEIRWKRKR